MIKSSMFFCRTYIKWYEPCILSFKKIKILLIEIDSIEMDLRVFIEIIMRYDIEWRVGGRESKGPFTFDHIMAQSHSHDCKSILRGHMCNGVKVKWLCRAADMRVKCIIKPVTNDLLYNNGHFFLFNLIVYRLKISSCTPWINWCKDKLYCIR